MVASKEDQWSNFSACSGHKRDALEEDFMKMRNNSDVADYLNTTNPRVGMDLSLYVEAELARQSLREQINKLEEELEQIKVFSREGGTRTEI